MNIQKRENWTPENELRIEVMVGEGGDYQWMEEFREALVNGTLEMRWLSGGSFHGAGTFIISKPSKGK